MEISHQEEDLFTHVTHVKQNSAQLCFGHSFTIKEYPGLTGVLRCTSRQPG